MPMTIANNPATQSAVCQLVRKAIGGSATAAMAPPSGTPVCRMPMAVARSEPLNRRTTIFPPAGAAAVVKRPVAINTPRSTVKLCVMPTPRMTMPLPTAPNPMTRRSPKRSTALPAGIPAAAPPAFRIVLMSPIWVRSRTRSWRMNGISASTPRRIAAMLICATVATASRNQRLCAPARAALSSPVMRALRVQRRALVSSRSRAPGARVYDRRFSCRHSLRRRGRMARVDRIDVGERSRIQRHVHARDIPLELFQGGRADDGCGDAPALTHERERHVIGGEPAFLRERRVLRDGRGDRGAPVARLEFREERKARARRFGAVQILARQVAAGERAVGEERHVFAKANLGQIEIELAAYQVVYVLNRDRPRQAVPLGQPAEAREPPRRLVRQTVMTDLAGRDHIGQRLDLFEDGNGVSFLLGIEFRLPEHLRIPIGPVDLVEV